MKAREAPRCGIANVESESKRAENERIKLLRAPVRSFGVQNSTIGENKCDTCEEGVDIVKKDSLRLNPEITVCKSSKYKI